MHVNIVLLLIIVLVGCGSEARDRAPAAAGGAPATASTSATTNAPATPSPPEAPPPDVVVQLAARSASMCARFSSGRVRCHAVTEADGDFGTTECEEGVFDVAGITDAIDLVATDSRYCARRADGSVSCWDYEIHERTPVRRYDGDPPPRALGTLTAELEPGVRNVDAISGGHLTQGDRELCALEPNPTMLRCRASAEYDSGRAFSTPAPGAVELFDGTGFGVCTRTEANVIECRTLEYEDDATVVRTRRIEGVHLAGGCVARADGSVACVARNRDDPFVRVPGVSNVVKVAVGTQIGCGLRRDGTVICWGNKARGDGSIDRVERPAVVEGLDHVEALVSGDSFVCALRQDGTVACWGSMIGYRVDPFALARAPVDVVGLTNVRAVAASDTYSCAITTDGRAHCWGAVPLTAQRTIHTTPTALPGIRDAASLILEPRRACVTRTGGELACFGVDAERALSQPVQSSGAEASRLPPVEIVSPRDFGFGADYGCAIQETGIATCWGNNDRGQLGRNMTRAYRAEPVAIFSLGRLEDIGVGPHHVCAVRANHTVACWGDDTYGQLGRGFTRNAERPVPLRFDAPCPLAATPPTAAPAAP